MAPDSDDMTDLDQPVTRRELRAELQQFLLDLRVELRADFATKEELRTTSDELRTEMSLGFAEMRGYVDFSAKTVRDELRTHFDVVAESLRSDIRNIVDWLKANHASIAIRVDGLETGHGTRLTELETRVTKLEASHN
jgi:hypothetical protein